MLSLPVPDQPRESIEEQPVKGDKLFIEEHHRRAAGRIAAILAPEIARAAGRFVVTIAGESGSGKSETAAALAEALTGLGIGSLILQQDDYFVYPPKTNERMRRENIDHVGLSEVHLDRLDAGLTAVRGGGETIDKPLVDFDADLATDETIDLTGVAAVIVEGTYTTLLANVDRRVFIDRSNVDTRSARLRRSREAQDGFLEEVLEIEHGIISSHKSRADLVITRDFKVTQSCQVREDEPDR